MRALFFALLAAPQLLSAQRLPADSLRKGARLRVVATDSQPDVVGELVAISGDTLWVRRPFIQDTLRYPPSLVRTLQLGSGTSSKDAAVVGASIGFVASLVYVGLKIRHQGDVVDPFHAPRPAKRMPVAAVPLGIGLGALIGSFKDSERWRDLAWPPSEGWHPASPRIRLTPMRQVRVDTAGGGAPVAGRFLSQRADVLTVETRRGESLELASDRIERVLVGVGPARGTRTMVGALAGITLGLTVAYLASPPISCLECAKENFGRRATWIAPLGGLLGGYIGSRSGDTRWIQIAWP